MSCWRSYNLHILSYFVLYVTIISDKGEFYMGLKTNYKIMFFTFIISMFMAMSLNNFVSSGVFLPALFLYFISNLAVFLEKAYTYNFIASRYEKIISYICCCVCIMVSCLYLSHALQLIEIAFFKERDRYRILLQSVPDTFFPFGSIDITFVIFFCIWFIPVASCLLFVIPLLSSHGYTRKNICTIIVQNFRLVLLNFIISLIMGLFGIICCRVKVKHMLSTLGYPQYAKYFWLMFATTLIISFGILIIKKKPK